MSSHQSVYARRFAQSQAYRNGVWKILAKRVFQPYVSHAASVLDLGCGYGELIGNLSARVRYAMDTNPDSRGKIDSAVNFLEQDSSSPWPLEDASLDVIVSSNFFEHLPSKAALESTLSNAARAVRGGGLLIALGPNIRMLPGAYWDFIDHHIPLSDRSMSEALDLAGFEPQRIVDRFLPYTMSDAAGSKRKPPLALVEMYLRFPIVWRVFGSQFLIVAKRRGDA